MKTKWLLLIFAFLIISAIIASDVQSQGTSKGTVIADYRPTSVEVTLKNDDGPWSKKTTGKPSIIVVSCCISDSNSSALLSKVADNLRASLAKRGSYNSVSKAPTMLFLKSCGISSCPNENETAKLLNCGLSNYDVVVPIWFSNGWTRVPSYRAVSKNKAVSHSFAVYSGNSSTNSSTPDYSDTVDAKYLIESIAKVMEAKE